jgi:hypothetical protein
VEHRCKVLGAVVARLCAHSCSATLNDATAKDMDAFLGSAVVRSVASLRPCGRPPPRLGGCSHLPAASQNASWVSGPPGSGPAVRTRRALPVIPEGVLNDGVG